MHGPAGVPIAALKHVHRVGGCHMPVQGVPRAQDAMFLAIAGVLDLYPDHGMVLFCGGGGTTSAFQGDRGMIDMALPPQEEFGCDGVWDEEVHTEVPIAGRDHGHLFKGIEV